MFHPFGNTTVLPSAEWHPEPLTRGTFSILSSCLITMSLCIWTSLHLNIPTHKKTRSQFYRKLGWMLLGLLAPELVVWNAWEQRKQAKKISALMQRKKWMARKPSFWQSLQTLLLFRPGSLPELATSLPHEFGRRRNQPWTAAHSWFVVMGGMAFEDQAPEHQRCVPGDSRRGTLTANGLHWMMKYRHHLIPDISLEYIEDKSTSDSLGKVLTCWQAAYFCIQCIHRLSQRLSITFLELNVFAHALCVLLLFLIWWVKPCNIHQPHLMVDEQALDVCACFISASFGSSLDMRFDQPHPDNCLELNHTTRLTCGLCKTSSGVRVWTDKSGRSNYRYVKILDTYWTVKFLSRYTSHRHRSGRPHLTGSARNYDDDVLNACNMERMIRTSRLVQEITEKKQESAERLQDCLEYVSMIKLGRIHNWTLDLEDIYQKACPQRISDFGDPDSVWLIFGLIFAGVCYGGLHLSAWASQFPSSAESILWRAASITIATAAIVWISFTFTSFVFFRSIRWALFKVVQTERWLVDSAASYLVSCFLLVIPLSLLWYTLCRVFIIVECFIMLAYLPESALHVPAWSAYIPHIA